MVRQFIHSSESHLKSKNDSDESNIGQLDILRFPMARLEGDSILILYQRIEGHLFPFSKYSVLCNSINNLLIKWDERVLNSTEVTKRLFSGINAMCKQNGIRLIITCITDDQHTAEMRRFFDASGIENLSLGVDYTKKEYHLYPYDAHPNEKADSIYAEKIIDYLKKNIH